MGMSKMVWIVYKIAAGIQKRLPILGGYIKLCKLILYDMYCDEDSIFQPLVNTPIILSIASCNTI